MEKARDRIVPCKDLRFGLDPLPDFGDGQVRHHRTFDELIYPGVICYEPHTLTVRLGDDLGRCAPLCRFVTLLEHFVGNELGNLVQRTASMIQRYQSGVIGELPESMHDIAPYHDYFDEFRFDQALDYVWTLIRGLNQYIEDEKPWQIAKEGEPDHLQEVLAYIVASTLQIADLLEPVMPQTSQSIIQLYGDGMVKKDIPQLFPRVNLHTEPHTQ